nr:nucleoside transporter C-terminal domain-containing protein [Nitrospira sp.]
MEEWPYRLLAGVGFVTIAWLAWVTGSRSRLNWTTIAGSAILAWGFGILSFWFPGSHWFWGFLNDMVVAMLTASQKGTAFLLGPLALGPGQTLPDGTVSIGFILAAQALPAVVFFAALMAGLYYLGVMQAIVRLFARLFYRTMGLSGAESLSGAANIFVGIEAGLIVRPYLAAMTQSELLLVLTCMMATVASTVLGIYVSALQHVVPQIAGHLISASIISIPCAVLISKLTIPEDGQPVTLGGVPTIPTNQPPSSSSDREAVPPPSNLIVALIDGAGHGMKMAVGIAALLIVFLGLEALVDLALAQLP